MEKIKRLENIDWDFKRYRQHGINNIHWFPANFIPQIPSILIANLSFKGAKVLDPFCGSGTTIVESVRIGRIGIGIDLNPLAFLITKVKTTYIDTFLFDEVINYFRSELSKRDIKNVFIPDFPNKENWFHNKTLYELGHIFKLINDIEAVDIKDLLRLCFSSILKACCSQRDHYTYIADNMYQKKGNLLYLNAYDKFINKLVDTKESLLNFYNDIQIEGNNPSDILNNIEVYNEDAKYLKSVKDNSVDLIVTSPPYANVTDYTTGHRLSFYWLGFGDINKFKQYEIGARWKRARITAMEDYVQDMYASFEQFRRVLKDSAYFCCVIGETSSIKKNVDLKNEIIRILKEDFNFKLMTDRIQRSIYAKRIRAVRGVNTEYILIFRK